jgi:hypothetical protein
VLLRRGGEFGDVVGVVDADRDLRFFRQRASRSIFCAPAISLETRMSGMPSAARISASDTFWQQTPTAPCSIWMRAMVELLCVLACGRSRTPAFPVASAMRRRLRSKASRSITKAGVSISANGIPGWAGGRAISPRFRRCEILLIGPRK